MSSSVVRKYEGMFLVDSALVTGNWNNVVSSIETVLKRANAELLSLKKWDDRRLCYPVAGVQRGTYVLTYFNADPASIAGIERDVQISEEILRVLVLRGDVIPQEIIDAPTPLESGRSRVGEFNADGDADVERDDIDEIEVPSIDEIE
ncbi:MAG: 30S ribosomal protein S6 [Sedimentisphaerales bacterium]|nr:30S ribosomal protein S6 [Sedimentisphaerales bacterium]MBN2843085.1 30S ribosomal protein S6 [Sedimentisphaerales bacterium]